MQHFHRTSLTPDVVLATADRYFTTLGLARGTADARTRTFAGALGTMALSVKMEGGHYTFVEVHTDQVGESRMDKNVKKFFNVLHRTADPRHLIEAGY
ncbi:hypothetical protein [Gemmatimonas aurantiaca]|uniref:hypothetical protein n=1 Tax=Gemmatimonas aurantiaca TaxID=173480 RepID=UPI00301BB677